MLFVFKILSLIATNYRANKQIEVPKVRLIDEDGEHVGVVKTEKALKKAKEANLDLVEVSPGQDPPVAKVLDFGKFKYEQKKKQKQSKSHAGEEKGVRFSFRTSEHDLQMKADQADKFLDQGYKVNISMLLRSREKGRDEMIEEKIETFLDLLDTEVEMDQEPERSPSGMNFKLHKK